jgi:homogentisate 1,2-dioxygenase
MTYYLRRGDVPAKRHVRHLGADGARLSEELMGAEGFSGASSLLYHRHSPSALCAIEQLDRPATGLVANQPLRPWHIPPAGGGDPGSSDMVSGRQVMFGNDQVTISRLRAGATSPLYRNACGDELVHLRHGAARMESVFGTLEVREGDYVVVPASTTHRWVIDPTAPVDALVVESRGHIGFPERYLTPRGQLREGAPFCERDIRPPIGPLVVEDSGPVAVEVRTRGGWARHHHVAHPFDVVAWDGCLWPYALSIHDFEPVVGRIHQPPPVHQTFSGPGFVVCSFVPRPYDFDPEAVRVPYHHSNVDSDEVLYYASGEFMSRRGTGIGPGSLTLHPAGFVHGPQPGSYEASLQRDGTDETAVMIDTFSPLSLGGAAVDSADPGYPWSWAGRPVREDAAGPVDPA